MTLRVCNDVDAHARFSRFQGHGPHTFAGVHSKHACNVQPRHSAIVEYARR